MNITPEQALQNLYSASRLAPLQAEQHEILRQSAELLGKMIEELKAAQTAKKPEPEANPHGVKIVNLADGPKVE